VCSGPFIETH
jgi:hypothetical protein